MFVGLLIYSSVSYVFGFLMFNWLFICGDIFQGTKAERIRWATVFWMFSPVTVPIVGASFILSVILVILFCIGESAYKFVQERQHEDI